jgi:hypothetical protein
MARPEETKPDPRQRSLFLASQEAVCRQYYSAETANEEKVIQLSCHFAILSSTSTTTYFLLIIIGNRGLEMK